MKKTFTIFFCFFVLNFPVHAQDDSGTEAQADYIKARLITSYEGLGNLPALDMGVDITLAPGWYTYWRMAGDGGLPSTFDWKNSVNVKDVQLFWPTPRRFELTDMNSFGYVEQILFPLTVTPETPGQDMVVDLTINAVVCHDICVPQTLHLSRKIEGKNKKATTDLDVLRKAKNALPSTTNLKTLGIDTAVLGKNTVVVTAYAKDGFAKDADLVVETLNALLTAPPEIIPDETDKTRAIFKIKAPTGMDLTKELFGKDVTMILINGKDAVERPFSF